MKRRDLLKGGLAAGAALALPARALGQPATVPAVPTALGQRDRALFEIARRELARAPAGILWKHDIVGIADFGLHSAYPRLHFVNLEQGSVNSYLCSHGSGSDPEHDGWLNWFSNVHGSNATSRGAYASRNWYTGQFGVSVRLMGLDPTNSNALDRAIVLHRAHYAEQSHVDRWGRLGRSNGCFAMGVADFRIALQQLAGGRLLFADRLGLMPDGVLPPPPPGQLQLLNPQPNYGPRENPGVF